MSIFKDVFTTIEKFIKLFCSLPKFKYDLFELNFTESFSIKLPGDIPLFSTFCNKETQFLRQLAKLIKRIQYVQKIRLNGKQFKWGNGE